METKVYTKCGSPAQPIENFGWKDRLLDLTPKKSVPVCGLLSEQYCGGKVRKEDPEPFFGSVMVQAQALYAEWPLRMDLG